MENLHVAGSSVFPTGGLANPTLTIVAPAIRLADHLKAAGPDATRDDFLEPLPGPFASPMDKNQWINQPRSR
jgi:choline dehydrogenase-like flavoprotein